MAFKMKGMDFQGDSEYGKFYGDRSRKEMRQDIREERKSLKDHGGSREEVKEYNKYQRRRKDEIRAKTQADKLIDQGATGDDVSSDKRQDKLRKKAN
jgi:hypothetical protein